MNEKDWQDYKKLHAEYEEARDAWHASQMNLRGAFSELARHFHPKTLNENRLYEEEQAHERFDKARAALKTFLRDRLKKD